MEKLIKLLEWLLSALTRRKAAPPNPPGPCAVPETERVEPSMPAADAPAFSSGDRFLAEGVQRRCDHPSLRAWGCYFFALYRWAQELNPLLGAKDYLYWYSVCVAAGHVIDDPALNKRAFIRNAAEVMNTLVGRRLFSTVRHVPLAPEGMPMFPVRVLNGNSPHFVLQNKLGDVWDSLGGGSYPTVNYREIM